MAEETQKPTSTPKFDARLAEGVAYFEQMLELMPEERTTLEFLVVAYEQLGEVEKGKKALVALTELLIKENDLAALEGLLPRLQACDYEPAKVLALKVSRMTAPIPELTPEVPKELTEEEKTILAVTRAIRSELDLIALLEENNVLTAEVSAAVRAQVESTPTDGRVFLVSALQILEKENQGQFEAAVEFLADRYGMPPIPLGSFDVPKSLIKPFPDEFIRLRGVVPFAKLGRFTLVATLNPADDAARTLAESVSPSRFYLAEPSAVEGVIAKFFGGEEGV